MWAGLAFGGRGYWKSESGGAEDKEGAKRWGAGNRKQRPLRVRPKSPYSPSYFHDGAVGGGGEQRSILFPLNVFWDDSSPWPQPPSVGVRSLPETRTGH